MDGEVGATWGLRYRLSIPGYLAVRAMDRWLPGALASGRIPGLEHAALPRPALPGPDWVRLRPLLCGICGSDMALLTGRSSPALSPFTSFPAVLGHEILAEVTERGRDVPGIAVGDRVVVDPFISCEMRGLAPCPSCAQGQRCLCTRTTEGNIAPGMLIGFCRDLPGGWSGETIAHRSQLYRVPPEIPDTTAVLVEPLSVALHAVLKEPPTADSRVLVIGGGTVGLGVLAALRLLDLPSHVTVIAKYPNQAAMARRLGADEVRDSAGAAAVEIAGASRHRPLRGGPVYLGGFDWVYDCVGSRRSVDESLRVAGPQGRVMLVGCAGELSRLDLSFVWAGELQMTGTYGYAREHAMEGAPHTFELLLDLLRQRPEVPVADLITHRFPLGQWQDAIRVNLNRGRNGAIKTIFDCRDAATVPEHP